MNGGQYMKATQQGQGRYGSELLMPSVIDGVHIGVTWRIRLNRPCAAATQLYVKLL